MLLRCCASSPLSWNTSTLSSLIAMTPRCASDGWPLGLLATMRAGPSDLMNPRATNRFAEQTLPHGQHGQAIHAEGDGRITFCHYKAVRHRHLLRTARPLRLYEASGPDRSLQSQRARARDHWKNLKGQITTNLRIYKGKSCAICFHSSPSSKVPDRSRSGLELRDRCCRFARSRERVRPVPETRFRLIIISRQRRESSRRAPGPQGLSRHSRRLPAARVPSRYSALPCRLRLSRRRLSRKATDG
jgi:hypothetical protein